MNRHLLLIAFALLIGTSSAISQTAAHPPSAKSAERQAILDALRGDGTAKVVYQVHFIRVHDGWAWADTTPLDSKTKQATAEGGPNLLHLENGTWRVMDLARVPEDPKDPMGAEDASTTYVKNVRRTYKGCPADIFPKPQH